MRESTGNGDPTTIAPQSPSLSYQGENQIQLCLALLCGSADSYTRTSDPRWIVMFHTGTSNNPRIDRSVVCLGQVPVKKNLNQINISRNNLKSEMHREPFARYEKFDALLYSLYISHILK